MEDKPSDKGAKGRAEAESLIQKVKRGIARLIDAYGDGLVDKEEFEPRIRQFKERLVRLEEEAKQQAELEAQEQQLRLVIGQLQDFAQRVKEGMDTADWSTRRDIIRALVKRIEVGAEEVRVIYRVDLSPFADGPEGGRLPDCGRGDDAALRCSFRGGEQDLLLQITCLQPFPKHLPIHEDVIQQPSVTDAIDSRI